MEDRRNLDDVMAQTVDDSVVAVDDLADGLVAKLRHDSSRARVVFESFHRNDSTTRAA